MAKRNSDFNLKDAYKVGNRDYSNDDIEKFIRESQEEEKRNEQKARHLLFQQIKNRRASKQQNSNLNIDENTAVIQKEVKISTNTPTGNKLKENIRDVQELINVVKVVMKKRNVLIKKVIDTNKEYGKRLLDITKLANQDIINENKIDKTIEQINKRQNEYLNKLLHNTNEYQKYIKVYSKVTDIETDIKKDKQLYKDYKENNKIIKSIEEIDSKIKGKDRLRLNLAIKRLENRNNHFLNFKNEFYNDTSIDETIRSLVNLNSTNTFFKKGAKPVIDKLKKEADAIDNRIKILLSNYAIRNNMIDGIIRKNKNLVNRVIKNLDSDKQYMDKVLKAVVSDNSKIKNSITQLEKKLVILNKKYTKTENTIKKLNKTIEKLYSRIKKYYDEQQQLMEERNRILEKYNNYITINKSSSDKDLVSLKMSDDGMRSIELSTTQYRFKKYGNFLKQHNEQIKNEILEYFFNHGGNRKMSIFCAYCSAHRLYYNEDTKKFEYYDKHGDTMGIFENKILDISYNTMNPQKYNHSAYTISTYGLIEMLDKGRKTFEIESGVHTNHNLFSNYARLLSGMNAAFGQKPKHGEGLITFYSETPVKVETTTGVLSGINIKEAIINIVNKHARELNEKVKEFETEIKNVDKKLRNITSIINNNKTVKHYKKTKAEIANLTNIDLINIKEDITDIENELSSKQLELNKLNEIIESIEIQSDSKLMYLKELDKIQRPKIVDYNKITNQYINAKKKANLASMKVQSLRRELKNNYNAGIINAKAEIKNRILKNKSLLKTTKNSAEIRNILKQYPQFKYYNDSGYKTLEKRKNLLLQRKQSYIDSHKKHQSEIDSILKESLKGTVNDYEKLESELNTVATELEKIDKNMFVVINDFYKEHAKKISDKIKQDEFKIRKIIKDENDKFAKELSSTVKCDIQLNMKEKKPIKKRTTRNKITVLDIADSLGITGYVRSNANDTNQEIINKMGSKTFESEEELKKFIKDLNRVAISVRKRTKEAEHLLKSNSYSDKNDVDKIMKSLIKVFYKWGIK